MRLMTRAFVWGLVASLHLFCSGLVFGADSVVLGGNAPLQEYPGLNDKINQTWQYEKGKYLSSYFAGNLAGSVEGGRASSHANNPAYDLAVKAPEIYFGAFDRREESPEWILWQNQWILDNPSIWADWAKISHVNVPQPVTREWAESHLDAYFPFPKNFRAFHYDQTNRIQVNPAVTFLPFYVNDPYGVKKDSIGFGYYNVAHEMLHYALERKGIPVRIHHCLFVTERKGKQTIIEDAVQFLIDHQISSDFAMTMGADKEGGLDPCGQLTAEEKSLVEKFSKELP